MCIVLCILNTFNVDFKFFFNEMLNLLITLKEYMYNYIEFKRLNLEKKLKLIRLSCTIVCFKPSDHQALQSRVAGILEGSDTVPYGLIDQLC